MHSATSQWFWRGAGQGGPVHAGGHSSVSCLLWALLGSLTAGAAFARSYIWGLKICICWHCDFLLGKWNPQQNSLMLLPGYLKADPLRVCLWASMLLWSANVQAPWRGFRVKHTFFFNSTGSLQAACAPSRSALPTSVLWAAAHHPQPAGESAPEDCDLTSTYHKENGKWEQGKK